MRIRLAIPDRLVTPEALEAALEATSLANEQAIIRGEVPPLTEAIRKGVKWKPEPFMDGEHFDLAHQVTARKWGDCDDLAPWLTGELRATGADPGAVSRVYKSGPDRWHVVTELSDGQILDPSKWAGMGKKSAPSVSGVHAVTARPFARIGEGALCCVPHRGQYWSRVDLPFPDAAGHIASHARAQTPEESLYRAVAGAIACGEEIDSDLCDRARMMGALLLTDMDRLDGDDTEIGSVFKKLLKGVKKAASFGTQFIPGVGPIASKAVDAGFGIADKALRKKKGAPAAAPTVRAASARPTPTPEPRSLVRALSQGQGRAQPTPDTIQHSPTGAVSVPLATATPAPAQADAPAPAAAKQPAMLYYHPANSIGPVVMRF
jgi:hypothetical protein